MANNLTRREALGAFLSLPALCCGTLPENLPEVIGPPRPISQWEDWNDVCHSMANMEAAADQQHYPLTHRLHSYAGCIQFAPEVMLIYTLCHQATVDNWLRRRAPDSTLTILGYHASDDGRAFCIAAWANLSTGCIEQMHGDSGRRDRQYRRCEIVTRRARWKAAKLS